MPLLTRRRAVFGGVLLSLSLVVGLAAVRLAMIPAPFGGLVEEAATSPDPGPNSEPDPGAGPISEPAEAGIGSSAGAGSGAGGAPAGVSGS